MYFDIFIVCVKSETCSCNQLDNVIETSIKQNSYINSDFLNNNVFSTKNKTTNVSAAHRIV